MKKEAGVVSPTLEELVRSVEENIGIRKDSHFMPLVVMALTTLLFIAAIDQKARHPVAETPIEIEAAGKVVDEDIKEIEVAWKDLGENLESLWSAESQGEDNVLKLAKSVLAVLKPVAMIMRLDFTNWVIFLGAVIGWIALFSLAPGIAGMFYRRSFLKYFLAAAGLFLVIELIFASADWGSIAQKQKEWLMLPDEFYYGILSFFLVVFLLLRVRVQNAFRGPLSGLGTAFFGRRPKQTVGKNIVICLDGSWNTPGMLEHGQLASTNVFKLFRLLKGERLPVIKLLKKYNANIAKVYRSKENPQHEQIGLYYNGVGNRLENNTLVQWFGGAFGLGAAAIKERAYMDIVREYNPGDRIYIFGFSRGAAIARLLAGDIGRRGIPRSVVTLRFFGRLRSLMNLWGKYDRINVEVLGCWDTVGAFGISKDILGIPFQKFNLLKDLTVGDHVKRAYHLVALDETRDSFEPTLMNPDATRPERIVEIWFSGSHGNVGGGYSTDKLSNGALSFMLEHVSSGYHHLGNVDENGIPRKMGDETWGIYLSGANALSGDPEEIKKGQPHQQIFPDPIGQVRAVGGTIYTLRPRRVPIDAVVHDTVWELMKSDEAKYAPESLFLLTDQIAKQKTDLEDKVRKMKEIRSLDDVQETKIREWLNSLTIRKWSDVRATYKEGQIASELANEVNPAT